MSEAPRRRGISWIAFAAVGVAMLAVALVWSAWRKHDDAAAARTSLADAGPSRRLGRFGTGFLTTHLLARRVIVRGILSEEGALPKAFELPLDRSGDDADQIAQGVEETMEALGRIVSDDATNLSSVPSGLVTSFSYLLDDKGTSVARTGLADLARSAPAVLALLPAFTQIEITADGHARDFSVSTRRPDSEMSGLSFVEVTETLDQAVVYVHRFVRLDDGRVTLLAPAHITDDAVTLLPAPSSAPRLYCGLPLIGSEAFPLPVIVSATDFHPLEKRDGVFLGHQDGKPAANRQLFEEHVRPQIERLIAVVAERMWSGGVHLFHLAAAQQAEAFHAAWFEREISRPLRGAVSAAALLEGVTGDRRALRVDGETQTFVVRDDRLEGLFDLATPLLSPRLPSAADAVALASVSWIGATRYVGDPLVTAHNLVARAAEHRTLEALAGGLGSDLDGACEWLNRLLAFLDGASGNALPAFLAGKVSVNVFPNQNGVLLSHAKLSRDGGLDDGLLDVAEAFGLTPRSELLDRRIEAKTLDLSVVKPETLAREIEGVVQERLRVGATADPTRKAFAALLAWFDAHPEAERLFARFYHEQHLLQSPEEARTVRLRAAEADRLALAVASLQSNNATLADEVAALRAALASQQTTAILDRVHDQHTALEDAARLMAEHIEGAWAAIRSAFTPTAGQRLLAAELEALLHSQPALFAHVAQASLDAFLRWLRYVERARDAVYAHLAASPDYDVRGWDVDPHVPTIVRGVRHHGVLVPLVVRPADFDFVVLYDDRDRATLLLPDAQLWIEGGSFPATHLTIGTLVDGLGVSRLPLRARRGVPLSVN